MTKYHLSFTPHTPLCLFVCLFVCFLVSSHLISSCLVLCCVVLCCVGLGWVILSCFVLFVDFIWLFFTIFLPWQLLYLTLKRGKVSASEKDQQQMLDPFACLLTDCLKSKYTKVRSVLCGVVWGTWPYCVTLRCGVIRTEKHEYGSERIRNEMC